MRVIDTRKTGEGYVLRTRVLDDGVTQEPWIEVPLARWNALTGNSHPDTKTARRSLKEKAMSMIQERIKADAIAVETGFSAMSIRRWARGMNV
jgi:hypothetical protein